MADTPISITLSDSALDELSRCKNREEQLAKLREFMDPLVEKCSHYVEKSDGEPFAHFEKYPIRTFLLMALTGKLSGSDGSFDQLMKSVLLDSQERS